MNDIPPITPKSTKRSEERRFSHKAKMDGKKFDRERRRGEEPRITLMSRQEIRRRYGPSIASVNRHTGMPHEHAGEIMHRTMTPRERRDFSDSVRAQLASRLK